MPCDWSPILIGRALLRTESTQVFKLLESACERSLLTLSMLGAVLDTQRKPRNDNMAMTITTKPTM